MYRTFLKPVFDFIIALAGIIILCPLMLVISIILFIIYRGENVFFVQERAGKDARIFKLIKFRTMNNKTDGNGNLLPDSERLSATGNFLRSTSIDELPQLLNVIKGELSIVGPRPLLIKYLSLYTQEQMRRHNVKPGITGWAQINGRNSNSWQRKFELDVWYVDHLSLFLDVKIVLLSFKKVLFREDINKCGEATNSPFTGNN
jgi:undecaprenyl phosphate N,N'-diacetylbacillosamine 1-phosphate transferase